MSKYFFPSPQAGTHAGAKIKQSPRLKISVLLLDVFEDVDQTGELCRGPGHQVGEAPRLVKVYRCPLASSINFIHSLNLKSTCAYFYPAFLSKCSSRFSILGSGLSALSMKSKENSFFILSSTEAFLAFFSASSKGTTIFQSVNNL